MKTAAILALLFLTLNIFGQTAAGELKFELFKFETPDRPAVEAERGILTVPENRRNPNGRTIRLAFVRFKSTAPNPKPPIVYLAGGPGSSGIGAARNPARFPMFMALREVADVIALDQRGVGQSTPNLNCPNSLELSLEKAIGETEFLQQALEKSRLCASYWTGQGVDLTAYNTVENADDIEDLRKALGASRINLLGISYGTHLGLTVLKRHGKNIDHAILAGVEGLDQTGKLPGNIQLQLEAISKELKKDAELSAKIPDFPGLIKRVFDRLEKSPETVEFTDSRTGQKAKVTVTRFDLQILTAGVMGDTRAISQLPALFYAMEKGDFSAIAPQVVSLRTQNIGSAMSFMMDCASGISAARFNRIEKEKQTALLGAMIDFPFPKICAAWNQKDLGDAFRAPFKTDVPTLFISGTLDGRTPVGNAWETAKNFSESRHLIIERAGHSDDLLVSSPDIVKAMAAFLNDGQIASTKITLPPLKWKKF
jgi:pimeloyl-ACP methyl ester carboxylesterase